MAGTRAKYGSGKFPVLENNFPVLLSENSLFDNHGIAPKVPEASADSSSAAAPTGRLS
jgi:hypothetical protein